MNAKTQDQNNSRLIIIILSILLALLAAFTFYNMKTGKDKIEDLTEEKTAIKKGLDTKIAALNAAMTDNEQMNAELTEAKDNLIALRDSVVRIKNMDRKTINSINRRVSELEKVNQKLIREADSLRFANKQLIVENDSARADIERKSILIDEKMAENDSLNEVKNNLEEKVTLGSALSVGNVSSIAMKERNSGALKQTNVARRVDAFRTNFILRENAIAQSGLKKTYIVVTDAMGKVIGPQGTFTDVTGQELSYTDTTEVDYNNADVEVILLSNIPEDSLEEGIYVIKVYVENKLLGTNQVELK